MAAEEVFLSGLRRKINNYKSLLQSGSHTEQTLNRLQGLGQQIENAGARKVIPQHVADALQQAVHDMITAHNFSKNDDASTSYQAGRDKEGYTITREQIFALQSVGLSCPNMAECLGVSVSTVKRRLRTYGLPQKRKFSTLSDEDLDGHVAIITESNKEMGSKAINARLKAQGIEVQRDRVQAAIKRVDPGGAAARAVMLAPIHRRLYSVDGPNALWHIDGNHKLVKWKIYVHAGVDGYSRMVVFIHASNNNRAVTVRDLFIEATCAHGIPSRLCMDKGGENQQAAQVITSHRGPNRGSAIQGKSVHNQRVDRSWVDVAKDVLHPFYDLFTTLCVSKDDGGLGVIDVNNRHHLWALHFVFLPRLNNMLKIFQQQRNNQGLRTEGNQTPNQLFIMGMLQRHTAKTTAAASFWEKELLNTDWDEEEDADIYCPLTGERLEELKALVDPLSQPFNNEHAVSMLKTVLDFAT